MSEVQNQVPNPEVEMYKLYIQKMEALILETERKMVHAQINHEIVAQRNKFLEETVNSQGEYIKNASLALENKSKECDEWKSKASGQASTTEQVNAALREREAAQRSRDDFYRELQNQIAFSNKQTQEIEALKKELVEKDKKLAILESATPLKKAAKKA